MPWRTRPFSRRNYIRKTWKGVRQWWGVISVRRASASALRGRSSATELSITEAPREPDESQQDLSRSVSHFLLRNTEPWKQIIGNDFMTIAEHTSDPAGRPHCSSEGGCAAQRQMVDGACRHAVDGCPSQSLMGSGVYSSSKWLSERRLFCFVFALNG